MIHFLFRLLVVIFIILMIAGFVRTYLTERASGLDGYSRGELPDPHPVGFYKGKISLVTTKWRGKIFNDETMTGINVFVETNGNRIEKYPFRTYEGRAIGFGDTRVLKIDYNIPENPWWLRRFVDEIVEVGEDKYLGKLHLRIFPFFPFTLEYFTLEK